ncbi:unnamed protein product, partial [marine sediment metagenome]
MDPKKKELGDKLVNILEYVTKGYRNSVTKDKLDWVDEFVDYSEKTTFLKDVIEEVSKKCTPEEIVNILVKNLKGLDINDIKKIAEKHNKNLTTSSISIPGSLHTTLEDPEMDVMGYNFEHSYPNAINSMLTYHPYIKGSAQWLYYMYTVLGGKDRSGKGLIICGTSQYDVLKGFSDGKNISEKNKNAYKEFNNANSVSLNKETYMKYMFKFGDFINTQNNVMIDDKNSVIKKQTDQILGKLDPFNPGFIYDDDDTRMDTGFKDFKPYIIDDYYKKITGFNIYKNDEIIGVAEIDKHAKYGFNFKFHYISKYNIETMENEDHIDHLGKDWQYYTGFKIDQNGIVLKLLVIYPFGKILPPSKITKHDVKITHWETDIDLTTRDKEEIGIKWEKFGSIYNEVPIVDNNGNHIGYYSYTANHNTGINPFSMIKKQISNIYGRKKFHQYFKMNESILIKFVGNFAKLLNFNFGRHDISQQFKNYCAEKSITLDDEVIPKWTYKNLGLGRMENEHTGFLLNILRESIGFQILLHQKKPGISSVLILGKNKDIICGRFQKGKTRGNMISKSVKGFTAIKEMY